MQFYICMVPNPTYETLSIKHFLLPIKNDRLGMPLASLLERLEIFCVFTQTYSFHVGHARPRQNICLVCVCVYVCVRMCAFVWCLAALRAFTTFELIDHTHTHTHTPLPHSNSLYLPIFSSPHFTSTPFARDPFTGAGTDAENGP